MIGGPLKNVMLIKLEKERGVSGHAEVLIKTLMCSYQRNCILTNCKERFFLPVDSILTTYVSVLQVIWKTVIKSKFNLRRFCVDLVLCSQFWWYSKRGCSLAWMRGGMKTTWRKACIFREEVGHRPDYAFTLIWTGAKPVYIREEIKLGKAVVNLTTW